MSSGISNSASRRTLLTGLVALFATAAAARTATAPTKVLFVCQFGSVKSAIAREWFRRRAAERHLAVKVWSRGLTPEEHLSPTLAAALKADGIDPGRQRLSKYTAADGRRADIAVRFDKAPPGSRLERARDWSDLGSMNADYSAARADLLRRIDALLDEIARR